MKKVIYILIMLVLITFLAIKNIEKEEINESQQENKQIFFGLFGIKHLEENKEPIFNSEEIKSIKDKKKFDKQLKPKLYDLLNMPFEPLKESSAKEITSEDKGSYTKKKIFIYTSNITGRYAYLLIPKNIDLPAPTILAMHGHGGHYNYGKSELVGDIGDKNQFIGKELVEKGYIVLAMDAPLFGDSALNNTKTDFGPKTLEDLFMQHLLLLGYSPLGVMIQEEIEALDFLTSLDIVDKNNIGCIGHSMGGVRCMYLSALDERVKATVLSNSVANFRQKAESGILHTWLIILPGIAKLTGTKGLLALITPRPLMIVYSELDPVFPLDEALDKINSTKKLYSILNKQENFETIFIPKAAHEFPKEYHEQTYEFLDKHLKNQK